MSNGKWLWASRRQEEERWVTRMNDNGQYTGMHPEWAPGVGTFLINLLPWMSSRHRRSALIG